MLEYDAAEDTAYRRSNRHSLAFYIALSIVLHAGIAALFLPWALRHSSREEIVEVFVLGEGGGQAGTSGAPGKTGEPAAGTKTDAALQAEKRVQAVDVKKAVPESRQDPSRVLEAKLKKDRVVHADLVNQATDTALKIETPQMPAAVRQHPGQPAAKGAAVASAGTSGKSIDGPGGHGTAGSGIGSGAPFGSAGAGIGTGGGGTGVTVFGSADAPKFLQRIIPVYPSSARRRGEEGRVMLKLTIDEKGNLLKIDVVESTGAHFAEAAVDAAKRSRFTPARRNNAPILSVALLPIRFSLR
jgi:TonB family protein